MNKKGVTLLETLIAVSVMAIIGIVIMELLRITFQSNSKTQLINSIKQNGQSAISSVEDSLRFADRIVCPASGISSTLTVVKDGKYTRIKIYGEVGNNNGYIARDFPSPPFASETDLCAEPPIPDLAATKEFLTNKDSGMSIFTGSFIVDTGTSGGTIVTIRFDAKAAKNAPSTFESQVDPVPFQTSIQLR